MTESEIQNSKFKIQNFSINLIVLILTIAFAASYAQDKHISPSDPLIRYNGRFDMKNPRAPRFDWPGNLIELRFDGTSCAVKIRGDGGLYNVFVNDSQFVRRFDTLETIYPLVSGLKDSIHLLRITKRFEGKTGQISTIKGFYIDSGKTLQPLDDPPFHKIEFIGGSNLLGFGIEADIIRCDTPAAFSNTYLSFGPVAARLLNAQYHVIAMSGKGLVRNWRSPYLSAPRTFGNFYTRTVKNDPKSKWRFNSWVPHVVVVSFGNNDFSTRPHTPKELFQIHYLNFIQEIKVRNPKAQIVCVTSSREPFRTYVRELVEKEWENGNAQIHFYSFSPVPRRECGCDWHPGVNAQAHIGGELAEVIRPLLPSDE
ncbi:MAG: hypothetical protein LBI42_15310 [Chitinispirillales bacterium]|jgi:hypothetical protein|nr:hypothetical protein [Chitinispirillales bacterium]